MSARLGLRSLLALPAVMKFSSVIGEVRSCMYIHIYTYMFEYVYDYYVVHIFIEVYIYVCISVYVFMSSISGMI